MRKLQRPLGRHSLRLTILWSFLPVIVLFVLLIGMLSYQLAARQIEANAYVNLGDTVAQTRNYLDNRLTAAFEQLVAMENDIATLSLLKKLNESRGGPIGPEDYIRVDRNLERCFNANYSILDSLLFYFNDGQLELIKKDYLSSRISFDYANWRRRFAGNRTEYYWRNLHANDVFRSIESDARIVSVFRLFGQTSSKVRGIILFNLREDFFRQVFQNTKISENGYLVLISPDGIAQFKPVAGKYRLGGPERNSLFRLPQRAGRSLIRNRFGKKLIVIYDTVSINRWKLAAVLPEDDILNKAAFVKNITLAVTLFLIVAALFLSNLLAKIVTTPLAELTAKVKQVKAGNLAVPFNLEVGNEIGVLNEGIGDLLRRVRDLLDQVRTEQEQKRQAELTALQAQIKPHFLYNTLDSIKQLCEMGEDRDAAAMVAALAKFFRISISSGRELISLAEEADHIRSYLLILKMRYADDFDYQIAIPPELAAQTLPKLTLQPLVENAVYHGTKQKRGKGAIRVRGFVERERLILEVADNGAGMAAATLQRVRAALAAGGASAPPGSGSGLGLVNVQRRLQLHFGPAYGLAIQSEPGRGTVVRVSLPWRPEEGESCSE